MFSVPDGVIPPYLGGRHAWIDFTHRVDNTAVLMPDGNGPATALRAGPAYAYARMAAGGMAYSVPVSMVPEPAQLPMLLAGALMLPFTLRRRRRKATISA